MALTITWNGDTTGLDFFMKDSLKWVRIYDKFVSEQEMVDCTFTGNDGTSFTYAQMQEYGKIGTLADGLVGGLGFYSAKQGTYMIDDTECIIPSDGVYVVEDAPDGTYCAKLEFPNAITEAEEQKTPLATIEYNGQVIASLNAGETATLSCAGKKMASDVAVKINKVEGGGGDSIITVDTLPETGEEGVFYRLAGSDGLYQYSGIFTGVIFYYGSGYISYSEMAAEDGTYVEFIYVKTKPTENIKVSNDDAKYLYYVEDEHDVFTYGDSEGTGTNSWVNLGINGTATDASLITENGTYAIVNVGWQQYIVPQSTLRITEAGIHDVAEYARVDVNIPMAYIVQTVAELPANATDGSLAIVIGG